MDVLTQAYRTTCVPKANRLDTIIPSEYIGRKLEIIILPLTEDNNEYNAETLSAMQETLDIMDGKIKVKSYATVAEMNMDIDSEEDD